jgi:hypothetical protein
LRIRHLCPQLHGCRRLPWPSWAGRAGRQRRPGSAPGAAPGIRRRSDFLPRSPTRSTISDPAPGSKGRVKAFGRTQLVLKLTSSQSSGAGDGKRQIANNPDPCDHSLGLAARCVIVLQTHPKILPPSTPPSVPSATVVPSRLSPVKLVSPAAWEGPAAGSSPQVSTLRSSTPILLCPNPLSSTTYPTLA